MVNKSKKILTEISAGELLDKISILEIKLDKIKSKDSQEEINKEYSMTYGDLIDFVGLDKNNNTADEIYYYINNQWEQNNLIQGSLMIRPVFGDVENYLTTLNEDDNENISIYPNPSSGVFYINKRVIF